MSWEHLKDCGKYIGCAPGCLVPPSAKPSEEPAGERIARLEAMLAEMGGHFDDANEKLICAWHTEDKGTPGEPCGKCWTCLQDRVKAVTQAAEKLASILSRLATVADQHSASASYGWVDHGCKQCTEYAIQPVGAPEFVCARHEARAALSSWDAMKEKP